MFNEIGQRAQKFRDERGLPSVGTEYDLHDALHSISGYSDSPEDEARQTGFDQAALGFGRDEADRMLAQNPPPHPSHIPLFWEGYEAGLRGRGGR